jgi:DNA-binding HxlR family transcriptional regulator
MGKRSYDQNCALARASDVIGERWTMLLLRDLLVAPRRFSELLDSMKGIGTNLLAQRLKDLQAAGIVARNDSVGAQRAYALTDRGRALEPAILALIRWGLLHGPENREGDHHRDDWDLLALKSAFQPDRAVGLSLTVQFNAEDLQGWVRVQNEQMQIGLGVIPDAEIVIDGTVTDVFLGGSDPARLLLRGEPTDLEGFISTFALRA